MAARFNSFLSGFSTLAKDGIPLVVLASSITQIMKVWVLELNIMSSFVE
ncbi:hypothetical protein QL112_015575 [Xenorhabdus griffiniae]|uniref:Uncharacterized protein n=1 Tax=Xenorhabdus griffiniae TaxID=351672 RepID=A0ABY9XF94_9GAMM|nr:hypothetical protein [Xenorhabdus griffiniae]WMV71554.1 hypothetical protein QL128_15570 [Xenorhabdus griffiniae]WNH01231.1 hypothetical protein QL112_015575 [Xenorhabdus griffiniae]